MADKYTRDKLRWLDQVFDDPQAPPSAFKLAYAISRHVNRHTVDAWPFQGTLGQEAGFDARTVRRLIALLISRGHLEVIQGRGRGHSNRYRWALKNSAPVTDFDGGEKRTQMSGFRAESMTSVSGFDAKVDLRKPDIRVRKIGHRCPLPI